MKKTKKRGGVKSNIIKALAAGYSLPATVFLTGASILVVEIIATRLLSPYFGSTIYTVSSVISVVLAALSLGYALGGRLADKYPDSRVFYGIIGLSGVLVLTVRLLNQVLLPAIGYNLSLISGPLLVSVLLFFVPSFFLGMLSPYAVKLQSLRQPKMGVGTVAGRIFFWSTLGSITGSLSAGFLLIPNFGLNAILASVGLFLIALGVIPLLAFQLSKVVATLVIVGLATFGLTSPPAKQVIYQRDGVYEKLVIYDGEYRGRPTRFFQQDRSNSGAMYLDSDELVYDYTKYYTLYEAFGLTPQRALVIGGGAYTIPKALLKDLPQVEVDVSEIEPSLYSLSKQYFGLTDDPRLRNHTIDGRRMLADSTSNYDYIYSDVYYSLHSIPTHFTTLEFFQTAKSKLSENGIFIANVIGDLSRDQDSFSLAEIKTFQQVFDNSYFFGTESAKSDTTQNIIVVGVNGDKRIDFGQPFIKSHPDEIIRGLEFRQIDPKRFELSEELVLTDDYAPVEHLTAKMLGRALREGEPGTDGDRMMRLIAQQLRYGSRALNTPGHSKVQDFIEAELRAYLPDVTRQNFSHQGKNTTYQMANIIGRYLPDKNRRIVIGTHYDSKDEASLDPEDTRAVMPGANDSASGVAVMLELARHLDSLEEELPIGVDLVFFDGEEGEEGIGNDFNNWYPIGSTYFASNLRSFYPSSKPAEGIVIDMVCDKDLRIHADASSLAYSRDSLTRFWDIGNKKAPGTFIDRVNVKYPAINDDHMPLNVAGIPSFLVIDYDYPAFHTTRDTLDKCSAGSLSTVSETLKEYLSSYEVK